MSNPEAFTSVSNDQLYDTWASTYDTDGNVLQAVDDLELKTLLPEFVKLTCQAAANDGDTRPLRILDFGCGTGRNTIKLLQASWHDGGQTLGREVEVHGWDASAGMLDIGRQKTANVSNGKVGLASLQRMDFSSPSNIPTQHHNAFSGILSTLVLEHLPLNTFFTTLATLLAPGGYALVTNMHPAMGRTTKAGFKTESGERVKGESYVHNVEESVLAAREAGLEVVSVDGFGVRERSVDEGMIERGEVGSRGRKWVGVKVWYGLVVRKRGGLNSRERK